MSVPIGHGGFDSAGFSRDPNSSTRSSSNCSLDDEFSKLKSEREKQRVEKALQKLSRSVSNRATGEPSSLEANETEILLSELAGSSRRYLHPSDCDDKDQRRGDAL